MDPLLRNSETVPVKCYESVIDIVDGNAMMLLVELNYSLVTEVQIFTLIFLNVLWDFNTVSSYIVTLYLVVHVNMVGYYNVCTTYIFKMYARCDLGVIKFPH